MRYSNADSLGGRVRWSRRLPLVVGIAYLVAASPFLLGFLIPSLHEGAYPFLFVLTVLPVLLVSGGLVDWLAQNGGFYLADTVPIMLAWCLWVALSFGLGAVVDHVRLARQNELPDNE